MKINRSNFPLKVVVLVTFIIMLVVNALANILPINGITSGGVSDFYANLFAPAGITFSIWGLIYVLLLLYTIYQFGIFQKGEDIYKENNFKKIGILFSISSILNTAWIFAWHYNFIEISLPIIIAMLICLILINNVTRKMNLSIKDYLFIRLPFSIYFGWLTVATIANVTTLLVKLGFDGLGLSEALWTVLVILIGLIITSLTIIRNRDLAYGLAIIWAYLGIYIKHTSNEGWNSNYSTIIFTVVGSILALVAVEIYTLLNLRKGNNKIRDL